MLLHDRQNIVSEATHVRERFNNATEIAMLTDAENYLNGDMQFLFEFAHERRDDPFKVRLWDMARSPYYISAAPTNRDGASKGREIRNLPAENGGCDLFVITYWGGESMLSDPVQFMDKKEQLVPATIRIWRKSLQLVNESFTNAMGISLLRGFQKIFSLRAERELNVVFGRLAENANNMRRDNIPIGVVDSRPERVNDLATDGFDSAYDGFILFSESGSLTGLCVRLKNVAERRAVYEAPIKLIDVFRCPVNY